MEQEIGRIPGQYTVPNTIVGIKDLIYEGGEKIFTK